MSLDLTPIVQPILAVAGSVIAALLAIYVPKALAAFTARTGIMLTELQRAQILGAVQTAAGTIETKLDQRILNASHVNVANDDVRAEAASAIAAVPDAMAGQGMTQAGVARMIVGRVDSAKHGAAPHLSSDEVAHAIIAVVRHEVPAA
jgi:hypothetical protein